MFPAFDKEIVIYGAILAFYSKRGKVYFNFTIMPWIYLFQTDRMKIKQVTKVYFQAVVNGVWKLFCALYLFK